MIISRELELELGPAKLHLPFLCFLHQIHFLKSLNLLVRSELEEYRGKSRFLYGESMGGAVALLLHRKDPAFWDGAVLVAPMCKVGQSVRSSSQSLLVRLHCMMSLHACALPPELKNSCFSDIREGEATPCGDHAPDAGGGRDPKVEDRAHQAGRHRRRLQGPRQA